MIVRTAPTIEGVLLATPVFREWKVRNRERIVVETIYEELLWGNPDVDDAGGFFEQKGNERIVRLDMVDARTNGHLMDAYAAVILGDARLGCRNMEMVATKEQEDAAAETRSKLGDKVAVVALSCGSFAGGCAKELADRLRGMGFEVVPAQGRHQDGWGFMKAFIERSDVFVGVDGSPETAVASTTETPMMVVYSWRDPRVTKPFRRGVPFIAVKPGNACGMAPVCLTANARGEFGYVYWVNCSNDVLMACEKAVTAERMAEAVGKIV